MGWIQSILQTFKKQDETEYHLDNEVQQEKAEVYYPNSQNENSKAGDARVAYHYPKGQFRFPLIPDGDVNPVASTRKRERVDSRESAQSSHGSRERKPIPKPLKKQSQQTVVKQQSPEIRQSTPSKPIKKVRPFQPTEIPSPVYGFDRPKRNEPVEHELTEFEAVPFSTIEDFKETVTAKVEDTSTIAEIEIPIVEQVSVIDTALEANEEPLSVIEEVAVVVEEVAVVTEEVVFVNEEPAVMVEEQAHVMDEPTPIVEEPVPVINEPEPARRHLPFNVLMLKQDKRKLENKMKDPLSVTNKHVTIESKAAETIQKPEAVTPIHKEKQVEELSLSDEHLDSTEPAYYVFPDHQLLNPPVFEHADSEWLSQLQMQLDLTLRNFNVGAKVVNVTQGPAVTRFEVQPEPGVKVNKITNLSDDIKLSLAARDIRIEAPIPGKHTIGIEVPNQNSRPVMISEIINTSLFKDNKSPLTAVLGLDISGAPIVTDLKKMPHGLIAGATGSGKSVCINSILVSLLYKASPEELKLLLIDPKMVELAPYNQIPHLVSPVITDVKAATAALKWAVEEMERRYELFAHTGVRDINRFNELAETHQRHSDKLPFIVIIIDELADLMMMSPADVEEAICRIAQKARACGIHLIVATQRPSVDVITGLIKANIPTRVAFSVSSQIDSRTIIDISGAEKLLGRGDMLFLENGSSKPVRLQGTFVTDEEIDKVVGHVRRERAPEYLFEQEELLKKAQVTEEEDELFYEACEFVVDQGGASTSSLQRRFKVGYNRAARLIDLMEQHGFISGAKGSKPRDVLITEADLETLQESSTIN